MLGLSYCLYQKKSHEGRNYFEMVGLTKNVNQAQIWESEDPDNRWHGRHGEEVPTILPKPIKEVDSLNPNFDSIEKTSEEPMHKKVKTANFVKKPVLKHLKEDIKESKESIKEDKKLSKKMKKGKC